MDSYLKLAKTAVVKYIKEGVVISPPKKLSKGMQKKAGVFVSLHRKSGELRGCIGTFLPTTENIACEIIRNAIAAATDDPRFSPVKAEELPDLVYSVDILSLPKSTKSYKRLNSQKFGLIVSTSDGRRGLLLPDIPGVNTAQEQFQICCLKAGINPKEKVMLQTFTVERHEEK